jgi:hypothetical protein
LLNFMEYVHHTSLFLSPFLPSVAEKISLFCKRLVSSDLRGLSSLNGGDSVITFKISNASAAEGDGGLKVLSGTSCTFSSVEGILSSFGFLGAGAFGSSYFHPL